jgi:cytochrome c6
MSSGFRLAPLCRVGRILPVALAASLGWASDDAAQLQAGKALFTKDAVPACAICHTLKDAGTTGMVGPVLDDLKPDAARVEAALRQGIGQMPSYQGKLEDRQITALAVYVATVAGAGK